MKSFEQLEKALEMLFSQKSINKINSKAVSKANSLIASGDVKESSSWEPVSANMQNAYIEENGIEEYAKWFLGVDTSVDPESKGHYGYVYTSDFKNVDRAGLVAIRQRAAQNDMSSIFSAAGKMIEAIDAKK
jgi:hypothetical protein